MMFGYFDDPEQEKPTFDPGLATACPVCNKPLRDHDNIVTISLGMSGDARSYFFRSGKSCYESLTDHQQSLIDEFLISMILQSKARN